MKIKKIHYERRVSVNNYCTDTIEVMSATMIPSTPHEYNPASREGDVFRALSKLNDDFYVFHSFRVLDENYSKKRQYEREIDFLVVHPEKGIIILEVKAGDNIDFRDDNWWYSNGTMMEKYAGPYNQADSAKFALKRKIENHPSSRIRNLLGKLNFYHAVVFPEMVSNKFSQINLPPYATRRITLLADDLPHPQEKIDKIYELEPKQSEGTLTQSEFNMFLKEFLCPEFHLIPAPEATNIIVGERMNQLLYEQYRLLDFLEDQDCAAVNGAAGTGKTMIALEKAGRHSERGERVLFLCYNRLLCDHFIELYKNTSDNELKKRYEHVSFYTINGLALDVTGDFNGYSELASWLKDCKSGIKDFDYDHVIIDEGQDFGLIDNDVEEQTEEAVWQNLSVIEDLRNLVLSKEGTFYIFYDRYQTIQGKDSNNYILPDCIENSDCRLTLKTNCRNTQEIANTSYVPLKDWNNKMVKIANSWDTAFKPRFHIVESSDEMIAQINNSIDYLWSLKITKIVILSIKSRESSCLANLVKTDKNDRYSYYQYKGKDIQMSTCRKFKGLEADAIILVDLDKDSFSGRSSMRFYVGASRAKLHLDVICKLMENDYSKVVQTIDSDAPIKTNPSRMRKILGELFFANIV